MLAEYGKTFEVVLYTFDEQDHSVPLRVEHRCVPWLPGGYGFRHLVYYLWLVWEAPRMNGVIKVFGSNIPTLPLVKLFSGRPMMVTYQWDYANQTRLNEKTGLKYWFAPILEWLALSKADLVLVTADWLKSKVAKLYRKKTVLLPNWVDPAADGPSGSRTRKEKMILYAGRLHRTKGVDVLIEAFARIKARYQNISLVICGEGERRESLERQAKARNIRGVEFRGRLPNAEALDLMGRAAVFVLPTLTMEGHPKALIEAMACGAACVATHVPGNKDVLVDGKTGLLVPPANAGALADALDRLLGDDDLRERLAHSAWVEAKRYCFSGIVPKEVHVLRLMHDAGRSADGG